MLQTRFGNYLNEVVKKNEIDDALKSTDVMVGAEFEFITDPDSYDNSYFDSERFNDDMDEYKKFVEEYDQYKKDLEEWETQVDEHMGWVNDDSEDKGEEPDVEPEPDEPEKPSYCGRYTSLEDVYEPDEEQYTGYNNENDFDNVRINVETYVSDHSELRFCKDWDFHEDTSLNEYGIEISSPPMPLKEFLRVTPLMFKMIDNLGTTDNSTGFHIGVSLTHGMEDVDTVKLALFTDEGYIFKSFKEREANTYAASVRNLTGNNLLAHVKDKNVVRDKKILDTIIDKSKVQLAYRYDHFHGVNLQHMDEDEPYVEFRHLGGSGYHRKWPEIQKVLANYIYNLKLARDPNFKKKEYYLKMNRVLAKFQAYILTKELEELSKGKVILTHKDVIRDQNSIRKMEIETALKLLPKLTRNDIENFQDNIYTISGNYRDDRPYGGVGIRRVGYTYPTGTIDQFGRSV